MFLKMTISALLLFGTAVMAQADITTTIRDLNISAEGDLGTFKSRLSVRFGSSTPQIDLVLRSVDCPADAALVLWLGERAQVPVESVLKSYKGKKKKDWGELAKSVGIKPGSPAFHALKAGNLDFETRSTRPGKGHHGKDHAKGKR